MDISGETGSDLEEPMERNLKNIIEQKSLKWIFVGGKGGVGKTTTASSLAVTLAKHRKSVLIISTDPAHNLSDSFSQKFDKNVTKIDGFDNLFGMEIDPTIDLEGVDVVDSSTQSFISEMTAAVPGIDEAMSFAEIMKQVQNFDYETIVFDTAPTGHTLRLLNFPTMLEKGVAKIMKIKNKFSGIFQQIQGVMEDSGTTEEQLIQRLEATKMVIQTVSKQFQNPDLTTFVCVCIPEFLSLYETERLQQELLTLNIDSHNIVVNQVLIPEEDSECKKCLARESMQKKYLDQIFDLYEDFNVTIIPLMDQEVRGKDSLKLFSKMLLETPPKYKV